MSSNDLRVVYSAGLADVARTYEWWSHGKDDPSQPNVTYSRQFFDTATELGVRAYVLARGGERLTINDGHFTIIQRPPRLQFSGAVGFQIRELLDTARLIVTCLRARASLAIVSPGVTWCALGLLTKLGVRVVPALHGALLRRDGSHRTMRRSDRWARMFFAKHAFAILGASEDVASQVAQLCGTSHRPLICFLPTYRRETFAGVLPPPSRRIPFRVLYAGRLERFKGVFDLLDIARHLDQEGYSQVVFDVAGVGSAQSQLEAIVKTLGLGQVVKLHGLCVREDMVKLLGACHAVIAPTTSERNEGFNQVVAESILAHRPVITSSMCPALSYVKEAAVEVRPDDVNGYARAIMRLADDREFYEAKRRACATLEDQFYDPGHSWGSALAQIIRAIEKNRDPAPASSFRALG